MAPPTLLPPTLGTWTPDSAHPPARQMQAAPEFLEGEKGYSRLPAMEWRSLLDHNPTSNPRPMPVTGLQCPTKGSITLPASTREGCRFTAPPSRLLAQSLVCQIPPSDLVPHTQPEELLSCTANSLQHQQSMLTDARLKMGTHEKL